MFCCWVLQSFHHARTSGDHAEMETARLKELLAEVQREERGNDVPILGLTLRQLYQKKKEADAWFFVYKKKVLWMFFFVCVFELAVCWCVFVGWLVCLLVWRRWEKKRRKRRGGVS